MRRRDFITLLDGCAAAWPLAAWAQPAGRMPRLGILTGISENDPEANSLAAFRRRLTERGWSEGRNIRSNYCSIEGDPNRIPACITELTATPPDVFLAIGTGALKALHQATSSIPIVFVQVSGPVEGGFVASLAHPGGNITGFAPFESSLGGKWRSRPNSRAY